MANQKPHINVTNEIVNAIATRFNYQGDLDELKMGLEVEQEHYDVVGLNLENIARIALAHLEELPNYYSLLEDMEETSKRDMGLIDDEPEFKMAAELDVESSEELDIEPDEDEEEEAGDEEPEEEEFSIEELADLANSSKEEPGEVEEQQESINILKVHNINRQMQSLSEANKSVLFERMRLLLESNRNDMIYDLLLEYIVSGKEIVKTAQDYINNEDISLFFIMLTSYATNEMSRIKEGGWALIEINWESLMDLTENTLNELEVYKKYAFYDLHRAIISGERQGVFLGILEESVPDYVYEDLS